jgi:hypothetical protein
MLEASNGHEEEKQGGLEKHCLENAGFRAFQYHGSENKNELHSGGGNHRDDGSMPESSLTRSFGSRGSLSSYKTAQSSFASYTTAPRSISMSENTGANDRLTRSRIALTKHRALNSSTPDDHKVFSSKWLSYLESRGILLPPSEELDWSGISQHVVYHPNVEKYIPLRTEVVLGYSATALVEAVMCRRVRLARKRIRCHRGLSKREAVTEVEHLQRLQHAHIVRVVGTYVIGKELCILMYPAAQWDFGDFMELSLEESTRYRPISSNEPHGKAEAMAKFFRCLSSAISYLHGRHVKHMDLKPKNLLVRAKGGSYKIYVADFGIAKSYQSAAESETDSPTSFTRTYAAPEVVLQEKRGFKADIFSLGCIFMEMFAVLLSRDRSDESLALRSVRRSDDGDTSYHANVEAVLHWYRSHAARISEPGLLVSENLSMDRVPQMLKHEPDERPAALAVEELFHGTPCPDCDAGPEPFEAAKGCLKHEPGERPVALAVEEIFHATPCPNCGRGTLTL